MVIDFSFIGVLSLAVGFAALGTTIIISYNQGKLTDEIHQSAKEQQKLLSGTRGFYASVFVGYVRLISNRYANVIALYKNEFKGKPMSQQKEHVRQMLKEDYDNLLVRDLPKIEAIELVKVFGIEIADKHWTYTTKMTSSMWQPSTDCGMALMMQSFKKEMYKLVKLKDVFLSFCMESYIKDDSDFQENYDLIKKLADSSVTPKKEDFNSSTSFP